MSDYSKARDDAREKLKKFVFDAIRSGRYGKQHIGPEHAAANAVDKINRERARKARNAKAHRDRMKSKCPPAASLIDLARLQRERDALRDWLKIDGRPQRRLKARARDIMTARVCLALAGHPLKHREMAEAMAARTGRAWTVRQGQAALEWVKTLEEAGVWCAFTKTEPEQEPASGVSSDRLKL